MSRKTVQSSKGAAAGEVRGLGWFAAGRPKISGSIGTWSRRPDYCQVHNDDWLAHRWNKRVITNFMRKKWREYFPNTRSRLSRAQTGFLCKWEFWHHKQSSGRRIGIKIALVTSFSPFWLVLVPGMHSNPLILDGTRKSIWDLETCHSCVTKLCAGFLRAHPSVQKSL